MTFFKKENKEDASFELRFYSGYRGNETPRSVRIGEKEFQIEEIIWRKRGYDQKKGKMFEVFKCRMEGETVRITVYEGGKWEISFSDKT